MKRYCKSCGAPAPGQCHSNLDMVYNCVRRIDGRLDNTSNVFKPSMVVLGVFNFVTSFAILIAVLTRC